MARFRIGAEWMELPETTGTVQNLDARVDVEIAISDGTDAKGVVLYPHNYLSYSGLTLYARALTDHATIALLPIYNGGGGGKSVMTYKGKVESYDDLPTGFLSIGDVWNIETADETNGILAGDNVAWNGTSWDRLAGVYAVMTGATASANGKAGLIPAPTAGQEKRVLTGGGTWEMPYGMRQNSTAYSVGDVAFSASLPSGLVLKCTTGGTTAATEPSFSGAEVGGTVTDGTVTWAVTRVLTTRDAGRRTRKPFTLATLEKAVAANNYLDFDILPGNYFTGASGYTYIFSGGNPLKGTHDYTVKNDHAGLIVDTHEKHAWNSNGKTDGGYVGSELHAYLVGTVLPKVKTDLGASHLYAHSKIYTTAINATYYNRYGRNTGASSNWAWSADQYISALSEMQVYGGTVWSSSGYDTGEADQQLEVFKKFKHMDIFGNEYPWLRDIVSSSNAAIANHDGSASYSTASHAYYVAGLILYH